MADYDWGKSCCGQISGHREDCEDHPIYASRNAAARKWRPLGLRLDFNTGYYECRRGCGTLVWDAEAHIKNVCTEFNPVAGDEI